MKGTVLALGCALAFGIAFQSQAALITFEYDVTGSITGTLGGVGFSTTNIVLTGIGDNVNRETFGNGFFIDHDSASIEIAGVGTFDFHSGTRTFVNNASQTVGWSRAGFGGSDLMNGPTNAAFGAWDMFSSIGPITGSGSILQWTRGDIFTSGGLLNINSTSVEITFTAIKVPGPGTLALLGVAGGLVGRRRRRR